MSLIWHLIVDAAEYALDAVWYDGVSVRIVSQVDGSLRVFFSGVEWARHEGLVILIEGSPRFTVSVEIDHVVRPEGPREGDAFLPIMDDDPVFPLLVEECRIAGYVFLSRQGTRPKHKFWGLGWRPRVYGRIALHMAALRQRRIKITSPKDVDFHI